MARTSFQSTVEDLGGNFFFLHVFCTWPCIFDRRVFPRIGLRTSFFLLDTWGNECILHSFLAPTLCRYTFFTALLMVDTLPIFHSQCDVYGISYLLPYVQKVSIETKNRKENTFATFYYRLKPSGDSLTMAWSRQLCRT